MIHELIDAGIKEPHELDFAHGPEPLRRHADAEPADQEFGERRVDHPLGAEALLQSYGGAEDAAVDPDVLAQHHTLASSSIARANARLMASTSVSSGIRASDELPSLARVGSRQLGVEMIEHRLRRARRGCQIALDRRLDLFLALGRELFLLRLAPRFLADEIGAQPHDRL